MLDQRAQPLLIFSGEAPVSRTIDIQHADNLAIHAQREDNFRITGGIAGNVAVKGVDVLDALDLSLRHRRAAYASPDRDPHAGQFALERSQHQGIAFQKVETGPVDLAQPLEQQRAGIGARKLVSPAINAWKSRFRSA